MSIQNRTLFIAVATSLLAGVASADDPHLQKWLAAGKGITAVEATFTLKGWHPEEKRRRRPPVHCQLWYDLTTGWWRQTTTVTRAQEDGTRKRLTRSSGMADGVYWDSPLSTEGEPCLFKIAAGDLEGTEFPPNPFASLGKYKYLERCLFAPHALQLRGALDYGIPLEKIQEALTLQSDQPSKTIPAARELVYLAKQDKETGTISHRVDFTNGVRGYETTAKIGGKVAEKTTCTNFRKIDGRWVAMKAIEYSSNRREKEDKQTGGSTVVIEEIKLNRSCDPRNIYFPVALGDRVLFAPGEPLVLVENMVEFRTRFKAFVGENAVAEEKEGEAPAKPAPAPKQP